MNERYILELETVGPDARPGDVRLRALLKLALRRCGLRCTRLGRTALPTPPCDRTNPDIPVSGRRRSE